MLFHEQSRSEQHFPGSEYAQVFFFWPKYGSPPSSVPISCVSLLPFRIMLLLLPAFCLHRIQSVVCLLCFQLGKLLSFLV